ncbi:MAG: hypothetical protein AAFR76_10270, partial [Planctomycetota bacterium]
MTTKAVQARHHLYSALGVVLIHFDRDGRIRIPPLQRRIRRRRECIHRTPQLDWDSGPDVAAVQQVVATPFGITFALIVLSRLASEQRVRLHSYEAGTQHPAEDDGTPFHSDRVAKRHLMNNISRYVGKGQSSADTTA